MLTAARTAPDGRRVVTLLTGEEDVRTAMLEYCSNVSPATNEQPDDKQC
jgi:hypothetical protein